MRTTLSPILVGLACFFGLGCGDAESFDGGMRIPAATGEGASWSPDGRSIAIPNEKGVVLRGVDGSRRQISAPPLRGSFGSTPGRIGWTQDGSELRYVTNVGPMKRKGSWVTTVNVDGSPARQAALGTSIYDFEWAPGEWPLLYATGPSAISGGKPVGPGPAIWSMASFGAPPERLLDLPGQEYRPEFSPDGKSLTFVYERREPVVSLWLARADGSGRRALVTSLISCNASWSPDGSRIAISATTLSGDRRQHLYVSAAGGRLRQISPDELRTGEAPAWTPDGRRIAYATFDGEIKSVRPDGSGLRTIADFDRKEVRNLMWSPDGKYLVYSVEEIIETD